MSVKLSNQQIDSLVELEIKFVNAENADKKKKLKESVEFKNKVKAAMEEYQNIPLRFKNMINYGKLTKEILESLLFNEESLVLKPHPDQRELRNKLIVATIDCENIAEVLKKVGFNCKF